ncbi:hypothetical protein [Spirosoma luteum]|uniref:hypothetical protein n=1 Tax=Spirosoma luteum TaxID=431553 RepID=UPI00036CE3EA|nr:hypothetical protein [Spirosoma luteum]
MSREALKFTDLDAFLSVMEEQGFGQQAHAIIYERDKLPYCSAYLIPTELLPATFDLTMSPIFGGTLTCVQEVNYLGTETFHTDFMIYPLSLTGFVEVDGVSPITFADDKQERDKHMIYVINLEDGGGQEFFLTVGGGLINLSTDADEQPQEFKTFKLVEKKIHQIRDRYPATCRIYALDKKEFDNRRVLLQAPPGEPSTE